VMHSKALRLEAAGSRPRPTSTGSSRALSRRCPAPAAEGMAVVRFELAVGAALLATLALAGLYPLAFVVSAVLVPLLVASPPQSVPWPQLPEGEREKDREVVLAMPELLASVGYTIARAERATRN